MSRQSDERTAEDRLFGRSEPPIGWLVFNDPARRNAVSQDMWERVPGILNTFELNPDIRVVVVTGAGDKAFVSGANVSNLERQHSAAADSRSYGAASGAARDALRELSKPSIAMIRGYCLGGGLSLAISCDLRIAETGAKFGIPAARLGLGYGLDSTRRIVEIVGPAVAKELLITARHFSASEAATVGLVNKVVAPDQLEATVREYCQWIANNAPLSVRAGKLAVNHAAAHDTGQNASGVLAAIDACMTSEDFAEGRRAFLEKRVPRFKGR